MHSLCQPATDLVQNHFHFSFQVNTRAGADYPQNALIGVLTGETAPIMKWYESIPYGSEIAYHVHKKGHTENVMVKGLTEMKLLETDH